MLGSSSIYYYDRDKTTFKASQCCRSCGSSQRIVVKDIAPMRVIIYNVSHVTSQLVRLV